jgi:hypothetical protein
MEAVAKKYAERVVFLFVYCREAHPTDGPRANNTRTKSGDKIKQATSRAEREETARTFCEDMKLSRRILVDEFDGRSAQRLYGGLNNPTVVIDVEGTMALKMAWTNGESLDRYLEKFLASGGKTDLVLAESVPVRGPGGRRRPGTASPPSDLRQYWSHGTAQGSGPVRFSYPPMKVDDIAYIVPMGLMVGAHVTPSDHMYFEPVDRNAGRYRYDVFAPANGHIVHIQHRNRFEGTNEAPREYDDYRVVIEHTGTFWSYFDLITRLDPSIVERLERVPVGGPPIHVRIPVKAGQVIGKVGGRTLDFGVVNSEVRLRGFVVPQHYEREPWKIHTVDPFDYFDEPLRSRLVERSLRKAKPHGGKIDYDVDGRLVGNWFREGTNGYAGNGDRRGYWTGHLAIVYHHLDPSKIVVSLGDYDGQCRQFWVKGNAPDPATVGKDQGLTKYNLVWPSIDSRGRTLEGLNDRVQGVLLVQLVEDRKLKVEAFPGQAAEQVEGFTKRAAIYER